MRTFAQKVKTAQPSASARTAKPGWPHIGKSRAVGSILHLHRAAPPTADPLELEADRTADRVTALHDLSGEPPSLSAAAPGKPQAKCGCASGGEDECESCRQKHALVQRSAFGPAPQAAHASVAMASGGSPLPASTRAYMEGGFGTDFADVRVHTEEEAATAARTLSARAFTVGSDIAFARDAFRPADEDGQHLLAHELAHVVQQRQGGLRLQRKDGAPAAAQVTGVRISCEDMRIAFDTTGGSYSYALTDCSIPRGTYSVGVKTEGSTIYFDFAKAVAEGEEFAFGFHVAQGQINPVTLFKGQKQVAVSVLESLPAPPVTTSTPTSAPAAALATRLAAFQQLVKNAGKLRMEANSAALQQWREFLTQELTPAQVKTQVQAEEVRWILELAAQQGLGETSLAEQWLQTPGPNRRWVIEQQMQGRYKACTGCHATTQAEDMDRALQEQRGQLLTPLDQLPAGPDQGPQPPFAEGEQIAATEQPGVFPNVAEAQQRLNAIQPYLRQLGPDGYRVLPPETLGSTAPASSLLADIGSRITQRQMDYQEFSRKIDEPDFDYLQLRPIVRDLLALADPDVRQAVLDAIDSAETWETVESVVVGAASIGLLILAIFPPTSAIGVAGALALAGGVSAHQIYSGYESYEQGRLYSLGRGAHDVLDPAQQEAADSLMAVGALNMIMGSIGVASTTVGTIRLIRSAAPPGGALGAVQAVEGEAGGTVYRVTGWGTRDPKVVVTGPNGKVIREGPLSSFRPSASGGTRATGSTGGGSTSGGGYVYPTEGGAARVAEPIPDVIPEPVPVAVPKPVTAPTTPAQVPPDVSGPLAVTGATSGVETVAAGGGAPQKQPVMPPGLSRTKKALWKECNQLHTQYKATQGKFAEVADRMDPLRIALSQNQATPQDRLDFCALLHERLEIAEHLKRQRRDYIDLDCDQFDWFGTGTTTEAQRRRAHELEWGNVKASMANLTELLHKYCS